MLKHNNLAGNSSGQALIQDFVREGGWLAPNTFGALLAGSGGMLPQKIFKIESARLA